MEGLAPGREPTECTYPMYSSGAGSSLGLTHNGDSFRWSKSSSSYRIVFPIVEAASETRVALGRNGTRRDKQHVPGTAVETNQEEEKFAATRSRAKLLFVGSVAPPSQDSWRSVEDG